MKSQKNYPGVKILFEGLLLLTFAVITLYVAEYMYADDIDSRNLFFTVMVIIGVLVYAFIAIHQYNSYKKSIQNDLQIELQTAKQKLSSTPIKVYLKDSSCVVEEAFECHAMIDDNRTIICQIRLKDKSILVFDNPEEFLRYFQIDK